ncbi:MAG TPA: hypothetical protein G4N96_08835 [Chloroflexi bacterium]|nr:MAG: hypothetical protein B6243_03655 [Anaerolineaceae bacterium 4572_5.2]HEY85198.1 hypothetical protein [Chloroflexota bacterium]
MKQFTQAEFEQVALDLELELKQLNYLDEEIKKVQRIQADAEPELADILYENLAYKLQNFYTGCERIFQIIVTELNGALPTGANWHKRLLDRMTVEHSSRPAVISAETARVLRIYLGFRHLVRHIYGYELELERVTQLIEQYDEVWAQFEADLRAFINWLTKTASLLDG